MKLEGNFNISRKVGAVLLLFVMLLTAVSLTGCKESHESEYDNDGQTVSTTQKANKEVGSVTQTRKESETKTTTSAPPRIEPCTLLLYGESYVFPQESLAAFYEHFPQIEIEIKDLAKNQAREQMAADAAAGLNCDLVKVIQQDIRGGKNSYYGQELLYPLDEFIESTPGILNNVQKGIMFNVTRRNSIYGMPFGWEASMMYYNKDLFDRLGVAYPTDDWTIDEAFDMFRRLASHDLNDPISAIGYYGNMKWVLKAAGGKYYEKDGDKYKAIFASDPATVDIMQKWVDLELVDKFLLSDDELLSVGVDPSISDVDRRLWQIGRQAFFYNGPRNVFTTQFEYDCLAPPQGPGGRDIYSNVDALSIHVNSENKDAAWEFIKYVTTKEYQMHSPLWITPDMGSISQHFPASPAFKEEFSSLDPAVANILIKNYDATQYINSYTNLEDTCIRYISQAAMLAVRGEAQLMNALKEKENYVNDVVIPDLISQGVIE